MSLSYWKREKNFKALEKGYVRDPEGFPYWFLIKRLQEEVDELKHAVDFSTYEFSSPTKIIKECADVSNFIDYIASKTLMGIPDKYLPDESAQKENNVQ